MDKVLKRRLIGASILIALAVIFLPMLLVGPEPELDNRGLREPLPERPSDAREVRRIPLNPELARVPEDAARGPTPAPRTITLDAPGEQARPADGAANAAARAEPPRRELPQEIVLNPEAADSEATERRPAPVSSSTRTEAEADPAPPRSEPVSEPGEPEAIVPAVTQPPAQAAVSDGRWIVQVASFGSLESSRATVQRLEALGHPVISDEIVRGDTLLYRLRTGPYADQPAAETARGQIAATVAGVQPIVREVEAGALQAQPGFAVQVGSFASLENAENETARLRGMGFEAFRMSDDSSGRSIWKVLVGTVPNRDDADRLRDRLDDEAGVEGLVVSHP